MTFQRVSRGPYNDALALTWLLTVSIVAFTTCGCGPTGDNPCGGEAFIPPGFESIEGIPLTDLESFASYQASESLQTLVQDWEVHSVVITDSDEVHVSYTLDGQAVTEVFTIVERRDH
ncbi:hypothetical protein DV096_17585 [Bradymonadaceae bacterium TMQ3]|nr:hypothetical protein DV096_17585 [Bradymonadaceae bacterium TMQ3]TXC69517.1 hypothetical protein FRC91_18160 [Bradymonadales bacterium TMQ1]